MPLPVVEAHTLPCGGAMILHWFHRHKWGPWGKPFEGKIYATAFQRRECMECGKVEQHCVGQSSEKDCQERVEDA